jgi:hypothetical protein
MYAYIPWIHTYVIATVGCGIKKIQNIQINAATTEPQTNTFPKYCKDNKKV